MIRTIFFLLACFSIFQLRAQGWTHLHGLPLQNPLDKAELNSIEKVPGNGYILAGYKELQGQPERPLLLHLDEYGNETLVRSYSLDSSSFHQVIPTSDGGYLGVLTRNSVWFSTPLSEIIKLDVAGDSVWSYTLPSQSSSPQISEDLIFESPGGGYGLLTFFGDSVSFNISYPRLTLLDTSGALTMDTTYTSLPSDLLLRSCQGVDGSFFITGVYHDNSNNSEQRTLSRLSPSGQLLWNKFISPPSIGSAPFPRHSFCVPTADTGIVVILEQLTTSAVSSSRVVKYNSLGDEIWSYSLPTTDPSYPAEIHLDSLGILVMTTRSNDAKIWDLDLQGGLRNMTIIPSFPGLISGDNSSAYYLWNILRSEDGHIVVSGRITDGTRLPFVMKLDSTNSAVANLVSGKVFFDSTADCSQQSIEPGLRNWLVSANGNPIGFTDSLGAYSEFVGSGNYALTVAPPANNWVNFWDFNCPSNPDSHLVSFALGQADTLDTLDFSMVAAIECPLLYVDISTPLLRRCDTANYFVHYCNYGTIAPDSAYVVVELDSSLSLVGASLPYAQLSGTNSFRFQLDTVHVGDCGNFTLQTEVFCDSLNPGRIHCVNAHIYPDTICSSPNPNWSGASLQVVGECVNGDSVRFTITNVGTANMVSGTGVWVVEDDILRQIGSAQLNVGEDSIFSVPANGSTWATLVDQVPNHPGPSLPRAIIEGCGIDSTGRFSVGYAGLFAEDDLPPYISIDCQADIAAYDPNDKIGFPLGVGSQHEIFASDELEYTIRFQNTGNDTAFKVVLRDRIPQTLDLSTIVMGASSHPFSLDIRNGGVVEWILDPIILPDSATNPEASQGFVRFSIRQNPNNQIGTRIENQVSIYFDYNPPIVTAPSWHTLRGPYQMLPTVSEQPKDGKGSILAFPNPFSESITFELKEIRGKSMRFELFDITGRMVRSMVMPNTKSFSVDRDGLTEGMYIYRLLVDDKRMGGGKILVQSR